MTKIVTPRALETHEIPGIVAQFRHGAESAKAAGFDGVELHGANGYLLDQFLRDGANRRGDAYGGSLQNRARLPLEVAEAVIDVWGAPRVGYKISPNGTVYSMSDSGPISTFSYFAAELVTAWAWVISHVTEPICRTAAAPAGIARLLPVLRKVFTGTLIANGGYDAASGNAAVANRETDLVAYGVPFLANPDLPLRYLKSAPLNPPQPATFWWRRGEGLHRLSGAGRARASVAIAHVGECGAGLPRHIAPPLSRLQALAPGRACTAAASSRASSASTIGACPLRILRSASAGANHPARSASGNCAMRPDLGVPFHGRDRLLRQSARS